MISFTGTAFARTRHEAVRCLEPLRACPFAERDLFRQLDEPKTFEDLYGSSGFWLQGHRNEEAAEPEYVWRETYRNLVESALRALYPFTSHWALRFSTTTRPDLTVVGPCLSANSDGTYGGGGGLISQDLGQFATAQEAVTVAAAPAAVRPRPNHARRMIPPRLGCSVTAGPAP
ncbi:DUF6193 family natural product biosynthesis protein [Streptomyces peucetius]